MADPVTIGAAVGWGMKAAGWIISPIISNLMKEGFSYLGFDTSKKLGQLEMKVLELELMLGLEAAQIYPHRNRLEPLLKNLRSAYYEAEDILDDVEYHRLKGQVQSHPCHRNWVHKIRSALPSCSFMKNQVPYFVSSILSTIYVIIINSWNSASKFFLIMDENPDSMYGREWT